MAELGETDDPLALVPGNVGEVTARMFSLREYARSLGDAGSGLAKIDTRDYWQGEAAEAFRERYRGEPSRWTIASESFTDAANALDSYGWTLWWAQGQPGNAITAWTQGNEQTAAAQAAYSAAVQQAEAESARTGKPASVPGFVDPGEKTRQAAREVLSEARRQLGDVAATAAAKIREAAVPAPPKPTWLDTVGDGFAQVGHALEDVGIDALNGLASFGNAMWHHPGDVLGLLGGAGMIGLGATGEAGGAALDLTGIGALVGVPAGVVSAGLITAGTGAAGASISDLGRHAATDNQIQVLQSSRQQKPNAATGGRRGTPTDNFIQNNLDPKTLEAAQRELNGEVVGINPKTGKPWDHLEKVREAQEGLKKRIQFLEWETYRERNSPAEQAAAQVELSRASKWLEYSKRFVPSPG